MSKTEELNTEIITEDTKPKKGRKSKYETHVLPKLDYISQLCREGYTEESICKHLDIGVSTFAEYKNSYPELVEALKSKAEADAIVESALFNNATQGDTTAQIFWLKNRRPNRWRDTRNIEMQADVKVETELSLMTDEELAAALQTLETGEVIEVIEDESDNV